MNLSEFKAWFEGFTENMDGEPNAKQWKRIKARVAEITPDPTPWPVYIERYVNPYQKWWTTTTVGPQSDTQRLQGQTLDFCSVGRAEARSIA